MASLTTALIIWFLTHPGGILNPLSPTPTVSPAPIVDSTATLIARKAAGDATATREAERILWERNWLQIKERFRGVFCCSNGKTVTNREKYISNLAGLDLSIDPKLQNDLERLISLIEDAEAYPDPNWNMVLTDEIEYAYDALEEEIRNRAIENGVDVNN